MTTLRAPSLTIDPLQRAAAEALEGPILALGGPGTGKTHTIMARAARHLKLRISPYTITCLTFSSRGAEDLRRMMENQPLTAAEAPYMFIGTVHHYASFYLRRAGAASLGISPQFTIWDKQQAIEVIAEMVNQEGSKGKNTPPSEISEILDWNGKNQTKTPEETDPAREAKWLDIIEEYTHEKRRQNTLDLDDLIPLAALAMERDPATRAVWNRTRSRHLLVDEFQDMTPRQYHLLNLMIGPTKSIIATADPNQSIYRWKGADPRLLEQFRLDHGANLNMRMLTVNHRGTRTLSEASSMLTKSEEMHGLGYDYLEAIRIEGPRPTLTRFRGTVHEMDRSILNSAEQLVKQGYHWEDMACIYRTHQTMNRMITQFSGKSIPHNILGDTQRDRNSNARCITALLALILNPSDANAFSIAAAADSASRPRRLNQTIADQVRREARADRTNLVEAAEKLIDRLSLESSNHRDLHYVVNAWRELDRMMDTPGIELYDICRRANTLLLDAQRPGSAATEEPQTFRLMSLSQTTPRMGRENLRQLTARFLVLMASAMQPDHQATENRDPLAHHQGITFGTIHSAKGMQWKIVWVVDATDSDLPHLRSNSGDEELMEEERVFYVAATRATDQLHFCYADPEEKGTEVNPSRFLEVFGDLLESKTVELQTNPIPPGSAWQGTSQPEPEGEPEEEPEYELEEE